MPKKVRFTSENDEKLIRMVGRHAFIWDMKHPEFKNAPKRDEVWKRIGAKINKTRTDCQKRWKHIRDYYRKQMKDGGAEFLAKKKRATYWDILRFLDTVDDERDDVIIKMEEDSKEAYTQPDTELSSSSNINDSPSSINRDEETHFYQPPQQSSRPVLLPSELPKRQKDNSAILKYLQEKEEKGTLRLDDCIQELMEPEENDEIDLFFKSMAITVKKFRPALVTETKMKVFKVITEMDILNQQRLRDVTNLGSQSCQESNPVVGQNLPVSSPCIIYYRPEVSSPSLINNSADHAYAHSGDE